MQDSRVGVRMEHFQERVGHAGTKAWRRLKKANNYEDWLRVGLALHCGRLIAMIQAGLIAMIQAGEINQPKGKAYNFAFDAWLRRYRLHDMSKGDRARLLQMMDLLPQIRDWQRTLTLTERFNLRQHQPSVVLREFKAWVKRTASQQPVEDRNGRSA